MTIADLRRKAMEEDRERRFPHPVTHLKMPQEFFHSPCPSTAIAEVKAAIRQEDSFTGQHYLLRAGQDWSFLSGRVVGAEE